MSVRTARRMELLFVDWKGWAGLRGEHKGGSLELERTRCARGNVDREPVVRGTDRI